MSDYFAKMRSLASDFDQCADTLVEHAKRLLLEHPASLPDPGIDLTTIKISHNVETNGDRVSIFLYDSDSLRSLLVVDLYGSGKVTVEYIWDEDEEDSTSES